MVSRRRKKTSKRIWRTSPKTLLTGRVKRYVSILSTMSDGLLQVSWHSDHTSSTRSVKQSKSPTTSKRASIALETRLRMVGTTPSTTSRISPRTLPNGLERRPEKWNHLVMTWEMPMMRVTRRVTTINSWDIIMSFDNGLAGLATCLLGLGMQRSGTVQSKNC